MEITDKSPTLSGIRSNLEKISPYVRQTPVYQWKSDIRDKLFPEIAEIWFKLELFQYGGSFKPRGAITNLLSIAKENLSKGVTAVSAGNHAIAVAFAARTLGSTAKVVMPKTANKARVDKCKSLGAEVILTDDVHAAFDEVKRIESEEGRTFVHPFEGYNTIMGTATLGYELMQQVKDLDAVVVPIGGGGLCAGIATAVKLVNPGCKVYGVEPEGADTMTKSLASGKPERIDEVRTIADSLAAPYAAPYSFGLCRQNVDEVVLISDQEMCDAMGLLFYDQKLAVEPAGAAATAALNGPLRNKLAGKRTGLIVCGANIDAPTFTKHLEKGENFYEGLLG